MRSEIRELRQSIALSQEEFARLLDVPLETLRTWDSARRTPPSDVQVRARQAIAEHQRQHELLSLDALASEFGIHQRTLRDAVRVGRLEVQLSTRSAFGRPIRRATRAAVLAYQQRYYRRSYSRTMRKPPTPTPIIVPVDYAERVTLTRHGLRLTLSGFAAQIGAANKAVVYQWESGKRRPSPVFWARIVALHHSGR